MPIEIKWYDNEKTIIRQTFGKIWTINELLQMFDDTDAVIHAAGDRPCSYIIDVRASKRVPVGIIAALGEIRAKLREDSESTVVIGANQIVRIVIHTFQRFGGSTPLHFADSIEEAETLIEEAWREPAF